ncbi:hypothetical protein EDC04DRAFT_149875 [Pisolithus marmoratus]|nr:hypothetical protein EDC04DRAFT_149875 [Pisolithus marmoratus]
MRNRPVHNLSDAFGFDNHYAVKMIDSSSMEAFLTSVWYAGVYPRDLAFAIPGVDEVMGFTEIMNSTRLWMNPPPPNTLSLCKSRTSPSIPHRQATPSLSTRSQFIPEKALVNRISKKTYC